VVTKTLEFRVGEEPRLYHGNLSYYLDKKAEEKAKAQSVTVAVSAKPRKNEAGETISNKERRRIEAEKRQEKARVLKPLKEKLEKAEAEIAKQEQEKATLAKRMQAEDFGSDANEARKTTARLADTEKALANAYSHWSEVTEQLEKAEAQFAEA
jgi:ATP-binding cassette subfamily F protein 3